MNSPSDLERIVCLRSENIFSPTFPKFNEVDMNIDHFDLNRISIDDTMDVSDKKECSMSNVMDMFDTEQYNNQMSSEIFDTNFNGPSSIDVVTRDTIIYPVGDIDIVTKLFDLVKNDKYDKKLASVKLVSEILVTRGKTISWEGELRFNKNEWNYFITVCNFSMLKKLENFKRIKYFDCENIIYFDESIVESAEEFLYSLYENF